MSDDQFGNNSNANDSQNQSYLNPPVPPYAYSPPNEKHAVLALIFGILGLSMCQLFAPAGWIIGAKSLKNIRESNGALGGDGLASAGMICGIIGTVFLALAAIGMLFWIVIVGGIAIGSA